ncbi:uncharacterized protein LOC128680508 isoform X2 [Plodia interpunctella]|uniref:uncharacterized protein LOC128680508 isoform X2 n=1 Tax=Plodia interpunctella TaxID=58824 RepID=UPI002367E7E3|nr:uncharacterized protein LOC128680508 isoform X2 [Plodia interpunctella]
MVSKGTLFWCCHGLVWAAAVLALWAGGAHAAVRYDTATPHAPIYNKYKYIPLHGDELDSDESTQPSEEQEESGAPHMAPSEMILTGLRTILDVVRNINKKRVASKAIKANSTALALPKTATSNGTASARGFDDYYDEHHYHETTTTTAKPMKQSRYTDPWAGYYDWIINEGSFKFWSVFQLFTAALLLYAAFSAIYYAKFNPILPDYSMEYDDYFLERTVGRKARSLDASELPSGLTWINSRTFQFILDAIVKHYEEE